MLQVLLPEPVWRQGPERDGDDVPGVRRVPAPRRQPRTPMVLQRTEVRDLEKGSRTLYQNDIFARLLGFKSAAARAGCVFLHFDHSKFCLCTFCP